MGEGNGGEGTLQNICRYMLVITSAMMFCDWNKFCRVSKMGMYIISSSLVTIRLLIPPFHFLLVPRTIRFGSCVNEPASEVDVSVLCKHFIEDFYVYQHVYIMFVCMCVSMCEC